MFEESLDVDRVVEIDYLNGDDAYKRSWVSHRRERVGIVAHNLRTPRGLARSIKEAAGELRSRVRRYLATRAPAETATSAEAP